MLFQDPGVAIIVFVLITLFLLWAIFGLMKKKRVINSRLEAAPMDLISQLLEHSGSLSENIFSQVREADSDLIPLLADHWSELHSDTQGALWEFWQAQGYIDAYIKQLGAKNEAQGMAAAQILIKIKNEKIILPLINTLAKPEEYVPARVAEVLLAYGSTMLKVLIEELPRLSALAKCQGIAILEELGDQKAVPYILSEINHPAAQVRIKAIDAIGALGSVEIADSLIKMMDDGDWGVRASAAKALGRIKAIQGVPALKKALKDDAWWVRENAQIALKKFHCKNI